MKNAKYSDNQTAFNYVIYMMIGSCFDRTVCRDRYREQQMHFHYREQKAEQQYRMEEICIRYAENILQKLPQEIFSQRVTVRFVTERQSGWKAVAFVGKDCALLVGGEYRGGKTRLYHRVIFRKQKALAFSPGA